MNFVWHKKHFLLKCIFIAITFLFSLDMIFCSEMYLTILYKGVFITLSNIKMEFSQKYLTVNNWKPIPIFVNSLGHRRNLVGLSLSIGIASVDVFQNWLKWFHVLFLEGGLLDILIDCMSTVSFLAQLGSGILCL